MRGHADAAFQQLRLLAAERPGLREALAAVVAGEDDDRVVGQALLLAARRSTRPIGGVQRRHHPAVRGQVAAVVVEDVADLARHGLVARAFPRPVRRREVQRQEERLCRLLLADVIDGALGQQVRVVADLVHRHFAFVQVFRHVGPDARLVREVVDGAAVVAEEEVVAALQRAEGRQVAQVPLAEQRRAVAVLLQQRRQGRMLRRQADAFSTARRSALPARRAGGTGSGR